MVTLWAISLILIRTRFSSKHSSTQPSTPTRRSRALSASLASSPAADSSSSKPLMTVHSFVIVRRDPLALGIGVITRILPNGQLSVHFPDANETWAFGHSELQLATEWQTASDSLTDRDLEQLLAA
jgi:hypothetical protein